MVWGESERVRERVRERASEMNVEGEDTVKVGREGGEREREGGG